MKEKDIKKIVKDRYSQIANKTSSCGGCTCSKESDHEIAQSIGYTENEISTLPEANLGLGCGNPTAMGEIQQGEIVLDLGSGAGFDCFLAAKKVGKTGKVIGIDMTEEMIKKAQQNAKTHNITNVEFRLGDIESLPVDDESVDVIISNCVINLAPDKQQVFKEAYRVLKPQGRLYVSDIVLLKEITKEQRNDPDLISGCVGGAILKNKYLGLITSVGFTIYITSENQKINKTQYQGLPVESLYIIAQK